MMKPNLKCIRIPVCKASHFVMRNLNFTSHPNVAIFENANVLYFLTKSLDPLEQLRPSGSSF